MYNLAYYSQYNDINNNVIKVEIYKNSDTEITPIELTLAADAITVQYESDNIFKPLKLSGCSINVLTKNVLSDLYTGKINDILIRIYKNGSLFWLGYNTPNIYSLEYKDDFDLATIEGIDTLSFLEYIPYIYINNDIVSFIDVIYSILDKADADHIINKVYVHSNINYKLNLLAILERNFFDEEGEALKMREVLEDILSFLGMTLIQYQDSFYVIDCVAFNNGNNNFTLYDRTTLESNDVILDYEKLNLLDIGIAESNCSISLGDVFNKINIIANTNKMDSLIPDAIDNENDIINLNEDQNKIWESSEVINENGENVNYTLLNGYFKYKENYSIGSITIQPKDYNNTEIVTEVTSDNIENIVKGGFLLKCVDYKAKEEPSSLNWNHYLTFVNHSLAGSYEAGAIDIIDVPDLKLEKCPTMIVKGGYFILTMRYKFSLHNRANECLSSGDYTFDNIEFRRNDINTLIPCRLSIGNYYFDGETWISYDDYNTKVANGYYKSVGGGVNYTQSTSRYWYKIKNDYGYWEYVNNATYESSTSTEKLSGIMDLSRGLYYVQDEASLKNDYENMIWIEEEYYQECFLRDRFYLIRKNLRDEKFFDTDMSLTNTVSWRMKLLDSEDGVAIKLPDKVLYGELKFDLYPNNYLGCGGDITEGLYSAKCKAFHISELNLIYTTSDTVKNIYSGESYEPDVLYTNVINDGYVTEFEDVKLKVNTYNSKATSYSYVIDLITNDFISNVTNLATGETKQQEHHIIQKYYNHYSTPKYIYQNYLNNKGIAPFSIIHENTLNKDMYVNSVTYDLSNDLADIQLIEI